MKPREIAALRQRGSAGVASGGGSSYVAPTRQIATITTPTLAFEENWTGTITLAKAYRIYAVSADETSRLRLYTDTGSRTADISRGAVLPSSSAGVVLDFWFGPATLSATLSPVVDGFSAAVPATADIPITITNFGAGGNTVTFTLVYLAVEV